MSLDRAQLSRFSRMALKELRETMRDRRTIMTLILMPVLVYPLLSIVFQKFLISSIKQTSQRVFHVGLKSEQESLLLRSLLKKITYSPDTITFDFGDSHDVESNQRASQANTKFVFFTTPSLEDAVANQDVDVGIELRVVDQFHWKGVTYPLIDGQFVMTGQSINSNDAFEELDRRLSEVNLFMMRSRLDELGIKSRVMPISMDRKNIHLSSGGSSSNVSLATLVPMILILMTMTGAVYPAIDLTAGERERGTLEAVMATPASHFSLLFSKYIAVLVVAMLTASMNVASMTVTLFSSGLVRVLFGDSGLPLLVVLEIFGLILLFAMFFSAVLLVVTSFARSFKEAQAYLIPLMLISIAPGIMSLMPDLKLTGGMAVVPLVNCILLARDLLSQTAQLYIAVAVVSTTVLYACAALVIAGRIFGADSWQAGSTATWSELWGDHTTRGSDVPTWNFALFSLAVLIPVFLLASQATAQFQQLSIVWRFAMNAGLTILLFGCWPALLARSQHTNFSRTFYLSKPRLLDVLAATMLGLSVWPFAFELVMLVREAGLVGYDESHLERYQELLSSWKQASPVTIVLLLAVVPAACEEFFFRGYLFSALRSRHSIKQTIYISAVIFGLFHLIVTDFLAWERLPSSTIMGCLLGYVCYKSGSLFPGIVLHAMHNGALLLIAYFRDELQRSGWDIPETSHLPLSILSGAAVVTVVGFAALRFRYNDRKLDVGR
ncbi:MAG: ABC transporter permease subunit [Planctomycetota bacterium]|nr:ABC transporter permease subunit [Planctomycetota bacterium]MDA1211954.1 ABC transporter permease subunit [Planctomycetota bacterium]